jgi:hypothetical protein
MIHHKTPPKSNDGRDNLSTFGDLLSSGQTKPLAHPYHGSAAKRRAMWRLRRLRDTVSAAVMGSASRSPSSTAPTVISEDDAFAPGSVLRTSRQRDRVSVRLGQLVSTSLD